MSARWEWVWRILGTAVLAGFLASAFTPLPNVLSRNLRTPSQLDAAEAIVVLGAGAQTDGTLGDGSLRRALLGILLLRNGLAPVVLFSGPAPNRSGSRTEAEIRADLARGLGVPNEAVLLMADAYTTREEASRAWLLLASRQVRRILLVTDAQHMARARALFTQVGVEVLPATTEEVSSVARTPEDRLRLMRAVLGEALARLYYRTAGYL